jgi:hypothetical protein
MAKPDLATLPYCPDCGATRLSEAKFCPHCGCAFTSAERAKGKPPAVAPSTRPMMPAIPAAAARALAADTGANAALDIERLEGVTPFLTGNVVNLRPRTAPGANVDEPAVLSFRDGGSPGATGSATAAPIGLGVTILASPLISDASAPDEPSSIGRGAMGRGTSAPPVAVSPVAPMRLHLVTQEMARVDDADALAPPAPAKSARAPAHQAPPPPRLSASGAAPGVIDISAIESQWAARLTSQGGLVDDATALATHGKTSFALGLGVTHQMAVHAGAALVDDPAVLAGGGAPPTHITRAVINGTHTGFGRIDDANVIAAGAPPTPPAVLRAESAPLAPAAAPAVAAGSNLANDWGDAAEKIIPRKDEHADAAVVPPARGVFFAPEVAVIPPPPAPEPEIAYVPAASIDATPAASTPAPWARFTTPAKGLPAQAPPEPKKPGSATMMMSLSPTELRALAEQLVQKGALSGDDVDAAKNKK